MNMRIWAFVSRPWFWLSLIGLSALCFVFLQMRGKTWVSEVDVEFEFVVRDETTREPISGAEILISGQGLQVEQKLKTDSSGKSRVIQRCKTTRREGGFNQGNTPSIDLPDWSLRFVAPGYYDGHDSLYFPELKNPSEVERFLAQRPTLAVKMTMQRVTSTSEQLNSSAK
jgi:hypothetical protein